MFKYGAVIPTNGMSNKSSTPRNINISSVNSDTAGDNIGTIIQQTNIIESNTTINAATNNSGGGGGGGSATGNILTATGEIEDLSASDFTSDLIKGNILYIDDIYKKNPAKSSIVFHNLITLGAGVAISGNFAIDGDNADINSNFMTIKTPILPINTGLRGRTFPVSGYIIGNTELATISDSKISEKLYSGLFYLRNQYIKPDNTWTDPVDPGGFNLMYSNLDLRVNTSTPNEVIRTAFESQIFADLSLQKLNVYGGVIDNPVSTHITGGSDYSNGINELQFKLRGDEYFSLKGNTLFIKKNLDFNQSSDVIFPNNNIFTFRDRNKDTGKDNKYIDMGNQKINIYQNMFFEENRDFDINFGQNQSLNFKIYSNGGTEKTLLSLTKDKFQVFLPGSGLNYTITDPQNSNDLNIYSRKFLLHSSGTNMTFTIIEGLKGITVAGYSAKLLINNLNTGKNGYFYIVGSYTFSNTELSIPYQITQVSPNEDFDIPISIMRSGDNMILNLAYVTNNFKALLDIEINILK